MLLAMISLFLDLSVPRSLFPQMENIGNFLTACGSFGIAQTDLFQTVDLYEGENIPQVLCTLYHNMLYIYTHNTLYTYAHDTFTVIVSF